MPGVSCFTCTQRVLVVAGRALIFQCLDHPGAYRRRANPPNTAFRRFYERGDLPIAMEHRGMKNVIRWKASMGRVCACANPSLTLTRLKG